MIVRVARAGHAARLDHEHALALQLEPAWALRPLGLSEYQGQRALILEDPGGALLSSWLGAPWEIERFLRLALQLTEALAHVHAASLVHNDIGPESFLVYVAAQARLTSFGLAASAQSTLPVVTFDPDPSRLPYLAPERTGRVDHAVDARSDLYALGMVLYELLTGALPFSPTDPLEWIHCHIARQPPAPSDRVASVPAALDAIVLKLLSKSADARYQTTAALLADLEHALQGWCASGRIASFVLAQHEITRRFTPPEKLYGRDAETSELIAACERVASGDGSELVLVSGDVGIGKSALLRSVASAAGLFALGSAEPYKPLAALHGALHSVVRQLLVGPEAELARWRAALLAALGGDAQLLIDMIPELARILGEQPAPQKRATHRYELLRRFLSVCAQHAQPLVLCIDDWHWLDAETLELLERLLGDPELKRLLLLGSYRDSEIEASHPLTPTLARLRTAGMKLRELTLRPLTLSEIAQLVADGMDLERSQVQALAELVHENARGNPFYALQFVSALAEEGAARYEPGIGQVERSQQERERIADLTLIAGQRAHATAAYASALASFETGIRWLGEEGWERRPELALALERQRATCEFLIGALPAAKKHLAALVQRSLALVDLPELVELEVKLYTHTGDSQSAVEACLRYLKRFDLTLPLHPAPEDLREVYERVRAQIAGRSIASFIDLPMLSDPAKRALLDVLASLMAPSGILDPKLTALTMLHMVSLSLEHGNCAPSCAAYAGMAQFLGPLFGDYALGYQFVALAVELVETRGLSDFQARVFGSYGAHVVAWRAHLREAYPFCVRASKVERQRDLPTWSTYAWWLRTAIRLDAGDPLDEVHAEAQQALSFVSKLEFPFPIALVVAPLRLTRMLLGTTPKFGSLDDDGFSEAQHEPYLEANRQLIHAAFRYWVRKLQARYFADEPSEALTAAHKAQQLMAATLRTFEYAEYHLFAALAEAALYPGIPAQPPELSSILQHHAQLTAWTEDCAINFEARAALVGAELARLQARELDAQRLYERAIQQARQHGFIQIEALGSELAARFYAFRGFETIAAAYLQQARACYARWGAHGKLRHLEARYRELRRERDPSPASFERVDPIDVGALLRASQALSGELVLDPLIETLMRIVLEHAGAERGCLILLRNGEPHMAAEAAVVAGDIAVTRTERAVSADELPVSALHYVLRTHESLILDDASTNWLFTSDAYVKRHQPKSLLCMPVSKQAKLVGALYLQNKLTARAFTPKRMRVLEFLASQAAVSLENAYLYADLQRSEAALAELEHVNRLTTMGELTASIAHEVNQPLAAIAANAASCMAWLAKDPPNLERAHRAAERIARDSHHAGDIIRSIRAMAKRTASEITHFDLDALIQEVLELLSGELRRHDIQLVVERTNEAAWMWGDRVQLQQVLMNLITNAIEAMKAVTQRRILQITRHEGAARELVVAVEDSGTGIEASIVERIFDPLFTTKREGLGMGLAICRSIIETHGGRLWVSPRTPDGSRFSVSLPTEPRRRRKHDAAGGAATRG